jgi:hypothetical protein
MRELAAATVLVVAVVVFRLIGPLVGGPAALVLANISPLAAVVVAGAVYLPRRAAFLVPFGALFISTLVVNWAKGWPVASPYTAAVAVCFVLVFAMAWRIRGTKKASVVWGMTLTGTLAFYLMSNTVSWLFEPAYARSLAGWAQAQTVGLPLPGAPPTWWFFLKSLAGDLLFAGVMIRLFHPRRALAAAPAAPAMQPSPVR